MSEPLADALAALHRTLGHLRTMIERGDGDGALLGKLVSARCQVEEIQSALEDGSVIVQRDPVQDVSGRECRAPDDNENW